MISYSYTKTVIPDLLQSEISTAGLSTIQYIETIGDDVSIYFSEELSEEQKTLLDSTVAAHSGSPALDFRTRIEGRILRGQDIIWEFREWVIANIVSPNNAQILGSLASVKALIDSGLLPEAAYVWNVVALGILDQAYDAINTPLPGGQTCRTYFYNRIVAAI